MDGGYGLCPLRLYGLSHYTALARELMFRNELRRWCRPWPARASAVVPNVQVLVGRRELLRLERQHIARKLRGTPWPNL